MRKQIRSFEQLISWQKARELTKKEHLFTDGYGEVFKGFRIKGSDPARSRIVVLVAFATGILALILAFIREAAEKARSDPTKAARWHALATYVTWRR